MPECYVYLTEISVVWRYMHVLLSWDCLASPNPFGFSDSLSLKSQKMQKKSSNQMDFSDCMFMCQADFGFEEEKKETTTMTSEISRLILSVMMDNFVI